ncbi:MAG: repeat-containing protein [Mycobacterium sp.]|nr:repeat-containing protein [Mycobacterium sp.]
MSITAASEALRAGDVIRAEELARDALARDDTLECRLVLAQALAWQGRGRDAEAVLSAVDMDALSDTELLAVALPRAANQFWMLSEPERATAYLRNIRNRVAEPTGRTIDALSATFAMNAGTPLRALDIAADVLAAPDAEDMAVAWAASTSTLSAARTGRISEVAAFAERAITAEHPGLLRYTVGLGQITALTVDGRLDEAEQIARGFTAAASPGRAIADVLLAEVLMARGHDGDAADLLVSAAPVLDRTGYSWGPLALMLLATALARRGDLTEAAKALSRAESRHGTKSGLFAPELGVARAWRLAAANDRHGAVSAVRQAAQMAERSGQAAVALLVWRDALQLGDTRAAEPIQRLTAGLT